MDYYLIDFENVRTEGLKQITGIEEGDAVTIFYSEQCKNIALDVLENIMKLNIRYNSFKVTTGTKNALDFQLSSYLGYLIGLNGNNSNYYIVSNDKGYDCLSDYWKEQQIIVDRISFQEPATDAVVKTTPAKKKTKKKKMEPATLEEMKKLLSEEDDPEVVLAIFNRYKTKQAICNGMSKHFKDTKRTSMIYKKLKPLLKEKNKS